MLENKWWWWKKGKQVRFEILDRLSKLGAGLSPAQKNDYVWWKESWDAAMLTLHTANWEETFMSWMQHLLDDTKSNAFSLFMFSETQRVLPGVRRLEVPGS